MFQSESLSFFFFKCPKSARGDIFKKMPDTLRDDHRFFLNANFLCVTTIFFFFFFFFLHSTLPSMIQQHFIKLTLNVSK